MAAENSKARYDALKAEAQQAQLAGDLRTAEAKFTELLALAERIRPGAYEVYAGVVTPLAEVYRKTNQPEKVERLYNQRVEQASQPDGGDGLELGLAQADLGFLYQNSDVSADRFHGERYVEAAMKTFEQCGISAQNGEQCRGRLADTAGIQGSIFFQKLDYKRAEPLFRRVVAVPEEIVQPEVLFVSLHALRGIVLLRKEHDEAKALEIWAARVEAKNRAAVARLRGKIPETGTRSRTAE
jgi:hypothetical protein